MALTAIPQPGVVGHALTALGHHIGEHQLRTPGAIMIEANHIAIDLDRDFDPAEAAAWRRSLVEATYSRKPAISGSRLEIVTVTGLLPDTGVRVQLCWLHTTRLVQGAWA